MKMKIVCWGTEDYILCNAIKKDLNLYDIKDHKVQKGYYLGEGIKVEVVMLEKNNTLLYKECMESTKDTLHVIFIEYLDEDNLPIINDIIRKGKIVIITEGNKISIDKVDKYTLDRITYLHFVNKNLIDISSLIYLIKDNYDKENFKNNLSGNIVLLGIEQKDLRLGKVAIDILKNSSYIEGNKKLKLNIHSNRELDIEEKLCIEDALKEYIDGVSMLIIKQYVKNSKRDKLYFNLLPIK